MKDTERKLDEARYFLMQLNEDDPYFDYILSAYLNAARSTMWVMRHEFGTKAGWEDWFSNCHISEDEKRLLKRINDLRIKATKQDGVKTDYYILDNIIVKEEYYSVLKDFLSTYDGPVEITVRQVDDSDNRKPGEEDEQQDGQIVKFTGSLDMSNSERKSSRFDLINVCKKYSDFLNKQITYCVNNFD